ncbi:MAG: phosphatidate cytidylyltransferase [Candidatus Omnitrophica bacterium]|nr:phosphatidate cytidylyltransferase [Candidatus Omnitrophota bacterium]MBU4479661.1 phosphatidate cytidylyltransferase [Candidatus Omnitrophota bacterium]MCG2703659.1 phosphatidate cytidylyltransferase [Candidatus Omnitrophota bacterium]
MSTVSLQKRVITAALVVSYVIIGIFIMPQWFYAGSIIFLIGMGLYEFYTLIEKKGILIYKYVGILIGILIPLSIFFKFEPTKGWELFFITTATLLFFILQFIRKDSSQAIVGISTTFFGIFYVSWFFSFLIKIRFLPEGTLLAAFLLFVTKMGDVGAYVIGTSMGKRLLITRISPKKTLEGALGGLLFSLFAAVISKLYLPAIPFTHLLIMGVLIGFLAQLGDLCESLIKRDCGVKDSGTYLPGLGGVLDIIDSIIFTSPIFYYYIIHFKLVPYS